MYYVVYKKKQQRPGEASSSAAAAAEEAGPLPPEVAARLARLRAAKAARGQQEDDGDGIAESDTEQLSGRERYSCPMFFNPQYDVKVEPLDTCVTEENPRQFSPVIAGEHLLRRFNNTFKYRFDGGAS